MPGSGVDDLAGGPGGLEQAADVGPVGGDDVGPQVCGGLGDGGVGDVAGAVSASRRPAACAPGSVSARVSQPRSSRRSCAWAGERLTWAMTGAGTTGTTPASRRTR